MPAGICTLQCPAAVIQSEKGGNSHVHRWMNGCADRGPFICGILFSPEEDGNSATGYSEDETEGHDAP